jgi:hypothetical protein
MTKKSITSAVWSFRKAKKIWHYAPAPIPEWKKWQAEIDIHKRFAAHELWFTMDRLQLLFVMLQQCFQTEDMTRAQLEKPQNINPIWNGIILLELQICFRYFASSSKHIKNI